jgi:NADH:ubiquinone oxidoreductase subunit 3 (subunit A)
MTPSWLLGLPTALALFMGLAALFYRVLGRWAPKGEETPGKRQPYACGEDLSPAGRRLSYRGFYRLALVFVIVHISALVLAMLPRVGDMRLLATAYLLGAAVCVDILLAARR